VSPAPDEKSAGLSPWGLNLAVVIVLHLIWRIMVHDDGVDLDRCDGWRERSPYVLGVPARVRKQR
jgi:hypothetical protein